jgi:formylglycine-generating enzyme required for sulfatase activity/predicted Ser/Thr protein kinase
MKDHNRHELAAGSILHHRYRIDAVIGQGGFGITYKAFDPGLNQVVCIKELFPSGLCVRGPENTVVFQGKNAHEFPAFRNRFIKEARELARFRHPNIVRVSEVFEANQTAYFVMDFVEGETLRELVTREGRLNQERALPLMQGLLDAVEEVHRAGLLHRDIKPDNVLIEPGGKVVLIDFGSAKEFEDGKTLSQTAILTPGYAPLEQYSDTAQRGTYTDIYALGATFYFLLTGRKPLAAIDRQDTALVAPHTLFSDISEVLSSAIMLALNLRPADRFQTVGEMRNALSVKDHMSKKQLPDTSPAPPHPPQPPESGKIKAALITVGLILLVSAIFILADSNNKIPLPGTALQETVAPEQTDGSTLTADAARDTSEQSIIADQQSQPAAQETEAPDIPSIDNSVDENETPSENATGANAVLSALRANMVFVQGGSFTMGCTSEQGRDCDDDEKPAHQVTVSSFWIGKYEVTQKEWEAVMGSNPSRFQNCPDCPVENVTWNDVQDFIRKLNYLTGGNYRMPTEAEWEFAARGGIRSSGTKYSGSDVINSNRAVWYDGNSGSRTHRVGQKQANELGLYDMSGNVWEWCSDWYGEDLYINSPGTNPRGPSAGDYRVLRGGSWSSNALLCRVSYRNNDHPGTHSNNTRGFRLVSPSQ